MTDMTRDMLDVQLDKARRALDDTNASIEDWRESLAKAERLREERAAHVRRLEVLGQVLDGHPPIPLPSEVFEHDDRAGLTVGPLAWRQPAEGADIGELEQFLWLARRMYEVGTAQARIMQERIAVRRRAEQVDRPTSEAIPQIDPLTGTAPCVCGARLTLGPVGEAIHVVNGRPACTPRSDEAADPDTPSQRPWTPDSEKTAEDGTRSTVITMKRACNGCGQLIGDVRPDEIEASVAGNSLPDVRGECPNCNGTAATPTTKPEEDRPFVAGTARLAAELYGAQEAYAAALTRPEPAILPPAAGEAVDEQRGM